MVRFVSKGSAAISLAIFIAFNPPGGLVTFSETPKKDHSSITGNLVHTENTNIFAKPNNVESLLQGQSPLRENASPVTESSGPTPSVVEIIENESQPDPCFEKDVPTSQDAPLTQSEPADALGEKRSKKKNRKNKKILHIKKTTPASIVKVAQKTTKPICRRGIDVSRHNKDINWQAVKDAGIEFAILRTSYGWENWEKQTDQQLKNNIAGAKSVGIPIGAYHYSYATNPHEALREAEFFIDRLKWTQWEYPVFIDLEDKCQKNLTNAQRTEIILTFLHRLQEAGYYTGFYTCLNWQRYKLDMDRLGGHELWIAHWNPTCGCTRPYGIWQYTSDGSVPGIEGRVDMDLCYVDYPSIIKNLHLNGF